MKSFLLTLVLSLALAGCATIPPAISDIRSDVVKVQIRRDILRGEPSLQQIRTEAQRGCREYGNVVSHSLSSRCVETDGLGYCLRREHLYACKPPDSLDPTIP